ncbi:hypothetical protein [Devosia sp. 2618]|uniref:hypothetical protein n=1 Tax=Devosia sp. 2618 TaxID=3156454 RepID=UPI00339A864D
MTAKEVAIVQAGIASRMRRDHNELAWAVWNIAALPKAKKMPDLKKLQSSDPGRQVQKQHWKAQAEILAAW